LSPLDKDLEEKILSFGSVIFDTLGSEKPSAFNKEFWSAKVLGWAFLYPKFKVNLFRLVDVLPTLRDSKAIAEHIDLYLSAEAKKISLLAGWAFRMNPKSLRAKIAAAITQASVKKMADDVIAGTTAEDAIKKLDSLRKEKLAFTVDLLGEYSVSEKEALIYQNRYFEILDSLEQKISHWNTLGQIVKDHPGETSPICISVKLSALYSQISVLNFDRSVSILTERLSAIVRKAVRINAQVYCDAEDSGYNPVVYETFKRTFMSDEFRDYPYPGMVVQAYAKNSYSITEDLIAYSKNRGTPIAIRLVKGAYWDSETIISEQNHWESPLYSKKESSDANFERISKLLIDNYRYTLPAIASHNIRSLSFACCYAELNGLTKKDFELQMLYGMAAPIARAFTKMGYLTRLYTPIGELIPGMGYLVRRLLENTSNESFLRHTFFDKTAVRSLLKKPEFQENP
jgi:RHH-type proline utilization regulon transcriptional repressor/proline dehydrogenase/delta 1-pyrroline-5-carboxylate dehydrogenase